MSSRDFDDVITEGSRRVGEMQKSVAVNRASVERTRGLIANISRLLSAGTRSSMADPQK